MKRRVDWRIDYLKGDIRDEAVQAGVELYLSHFATCPDAKSHRKAQ